MAGVAVASWDLALRLPASLRPRAARLEHNARESFMPALLRAMERKLAACYGEHAVIRIRRLDLKLRLSASELASNQLAETLAEDLAGHLRTKAILPGPASVACPADAPIVVYADQAHFAATRLAAAAQRLPGPDGEKEAPDRVWREVRVLSRETVAQTLSRLLDARCLPEVLAVLPPASLRALPRELGSALPRAVLQVIERVLAGTGGAPGGDASARGEAGASPENSHERPTPAPPPAPASAQARPSETKVTRKRRARSQEAPPPADPGTGAVASGDQAPANDDTVFSPPVPSTERRSAFPPAKAPDRAPEPDVAGSLSNTEPEWQVEPEDHLTAHEPLTFASSWCGLAYLLRIALLCELPERLWQIGVDEGAVLARALGKVAGEPDPVWLMLSAHFPDPPKAIGHVPGWALDELREGALAAGLRLLSNDQSDGTARAEIEAAISAWLARFDAPAEDALCTWIAAFLLAMFGAMTGADFAGGAADTHLARTGHVLVGNGEVIIVQPLAQIDIDVRRAGLDTDPGWLAWRDVTLRLAFVGDEDLS